MKKTSRAMILCLICGLLLSSCQNQTNDPPLSTDSQTDKLLIESQTKIAYYEELVVNLQEQMLDLKGALYTSRAEYDALYALYQAAIKAQPDASTGDSGQAVSFRYRKENNGIVITDYIGTSREVIVPSFIEGLPVRAIFDRAFSQNTEITSVTVPEGVETIGWFAFSGCIALTRVNLPASVKTIAYGVFENCNPALVVSCVQGSYAESYAISYGIRTK